jgi:uncharacterized membrane protein
MHAREQVMLVAVLSIVLLLATWLSFQCGLAVHVLPDSLATFLFDEP